MGPLIAGISAASPAAAGGSSILGPISAALGPLVAGISMDSPLSKKKRQTGSNNDAIIQALLSQPSFRPESGRLDFMPITTSFSNPIQDFSRRSILDLLGGIYG